MPVLLDGLLDGLRPSRCALAPQQRYSLSAQARGTGVTPEMLAAPAAQVSPDQLLAPQRGPAASRLERQSPPEPRADFCFRYRRLPFATCAMATTRWGRVSTARVPGLQTLCRSRDGRRIRSCRLAPCSGARAGVPEARATGPGHHRQWPEADADSARERWAGGDHRCWALVDRVDDLGVVNPAQVRGGDREIGMPELALYDQQGNSLA